MADIDTTVAALAQALLARSWRMACAESCTGGLVAAACTSLAGSSHWFDRGFVTYSNEAKVQMLGVDAALIAQHGAVSEAVVRAMAQAARDRSGAQIAVSVSGVAGPGGGTATKPVGLVWFAWATAEHTRSDDVRFAGDRSAVRDAAVLHALRVTLSEVAG